MPRSPDRRVAARWVVTPGGVVGPAEVVVEDGRVTAVARVAAAPERILCPGFVDLQVNGIDDVDVAGAEGADWDRLDEALLDQGVTAWCPTLTTAPREDYPAALGRIAAAARRGGHRPTVIGAHLEGPFLGGRPGAHPAHLVAPLDVDWLCGLPGPVRVVTIGPEQHGAAEAIERLAARGIVVALGHSDASAEDTARAAGAGATLVTHLFNAMAPFHHRGPGLVGAALADDRLVVSLIADLVHVHPVALTAAVRAKGPGRWLLVTDAVAWRSRQAAARGVALVDGAARLPDGTLAGSALTMPAALANVVGAGVPLADAVAAAATVPARVLGLATRGWIGPGARADLVALSPALDVVGTWVSGEPVRG